VFRRSTLSLGFALLLLMASPAGASNDPEVQLIYDSIRSRYPDLRVYCQMSEDERRKVAVDATLQLASARKVQQPFSSGPAAGALLRQDCGITTVVDPAALRWMATADPLKFSPERGRLGLFTSVQSMSNKVYAPGGDGPFPAVVINSTKGVSDHLRVHAKSLLEAGFAVLIVDTFGPRGYRAGVREPLPAEFARDAYDALAHLRTLPYIDRERIYQTGYSYGGLAAALLASPEGAQRFNAQGRFRATVANYGSCGIAGAFTGARADAALMPMLSVDSDRPILMLMAELDIETPPSTCFPLLEEMRAAGKEVHWHIYPGTTHAWDKLENNGYVYRTNAGETMTYRYDASVTRDATQRMIAFFNRFR
jgi:dienelactone hydrolase